jgi:hypothetical protein
VDYTNLPRMIEKQRAAILALIAARQPLAAIHPPLTDSHEFAFDENGDALANARGDAITRAEQIAGLAETGCALPRYSYRLGAEPCTLAAALDHLLRPLLATEQIWPFLEPVDVAEATDYYTVISAPMDFAQIKRRIGSGYYRTLRLFITDVRRIVSNCITYNGEDNVYGKCALAIEAVLERGLAHVRELRADEP